MTSPPCPSTGPARRPPSSSPRRRPSRARDGPALPAPAAAAHTGAVPDATPTAAPTAVASAVFSVPAETVWAYRLDFANLPGYNPDVSDVRAHRRRERRRPGRRAGPRGPLHLRVWPTRADRACTTRSSSGPWRPSPRHSWPPAWRAAATPTKSSWCSPAPRRGLRGDAHALGHAARRPARRGARRGGGRQPGVDQQGAAPHERGARGRRRLEPVRRRRRGLRSVGVLRVRFRQPLGQVRQHLDADARRRHEHGTELPGVEHQQLHGRHRHDVGRADARRGGAPARRNSHRGRSD